MANPVARIAQVGIQSLSLYPYGALLGGGVPDPTTLEALAGLQSLDITINSTDVQGFGGESVYELFNAEVKREVELKFSAFDYTLRLLLITLGGSLTTVSADGFGKEVQYLAANKNDRTPYFRLEAFTNLGNGTEKVVFPKCRVTGGVSMKMASEQISMPDISCRALYDPTYIRQDGVVGAAYDVFYGDGTGNTALHS